MTSQPLPRASAAIGSPIPSTFPIDDLRASGDISMPKNSRGPYEYSADYTDNSFRITATYNGPPASGVPKMFTIDESMNLREGQ